MSDAVENLIYQFLSGAITAAGVGTPLYGIEVRDTFYKDIKNDSGLAIGDATSDFGRGPGEAIGECDAELIVAVYSRVMGANLKERAAARTKLYQIEGAVCKLLLDDETMGERVCTARPLRAVRGWNNINGKPYAIANIPIVFNETGAINFE
jgi:hypothetical protein